jgi:uncharacterized membrane protein YeaQ/YmgE (transglycosylase-associated protein family)
MGYIYGWICIGLAAAFGAWILPFRRGVLGITLNASSAVIGAVAAPSVAVALGMRHDSPLGLPIAGLGALMLLAVVHLSWTLTKPVRRHPRRPATVPRV